MKIARPRLPLSINFNSTGGPPTEGAPPLATSVRGLSLKKRALLPSSLPSPSALSFFPGHSARCGCEQKRTKVWGLPRKIVINRRVADLERATFITRVTFVALPLFLSLCMSSAIKSRELYLRVIWEERLVRRAISENLAPTYRRVNGKTFPRGGNYRDYLKSTIMVLRNPNGQTFLARNGLFHSACLRRYTLSFLTYFYFPQPSRFALFFRCICLRFVETPREGEGGWSRRSQRLYPFSLLIADSYRCLDLSVENAWRII